MKRLQRLNLLHNWDAAFPIILGWAAAGLIILGACCCGLALFAWKVLVA